MSNTNSDTAAAISCSLLKFGTVFGSAGAVTPVLLTHSGISEGLDVVLTLCATSAPFYVSNGSVLVFDVLL